MLVFDDNNCDLNLILDQFLRDGIVFLNCSHVFANSHLSGIEDYISDHTSDMNILSAFEPQAGNDYVYIIYDGDVNTYDQAKNACQRHFGQLLDKAN